MFGPALLVWIGVLVVLVYLAYRIIPAAGRYGAEDAGRRRERRAEGTRQVRR